MCLGRSPLGPRGMPERLKRSSWSPFLSPMDIIEAAYYRRSLPFLVIRLFAILLMGNCLPQHVAPAHASRDLIVVAGLSGLWARTATLAVPSTCPTRSITPPFHDHAGYFVKGAETQDFKLSRPCNALPFLAHYLR